MDAITRRTLLTRSAQGAAGLALAGPLASTGLVADALGATAPLSVKPGGPANLRTLQKWSEYLAGLGARHTGGPSQDELIDDLQDAMASLGWQTDRKTQTFQHWEASDFGLAVSQGGGAEQALNAAHYYPYSGTTPADGVVGELAYANRGTAADFAAGSFAGKIAVVDVPVPSTPIGALFNPWFGFPPDVDPTAPYDRSWTAAVPTLAAAKSAGAAGVVIILPEAPADAIGQYIPFKRALQGLPAIHVDAQVGNELRQLAQGSGNAGRLILPSTTEADTTDAVLATLPGRSDEVVLVHTHTDGTNLIEENGMLGMLSIAQRLTARATPARPSTFAFYFATGHFATGVVASASYLTDYPDLASRTKAGVTIEHLGCPEYVDDHVSSYGPTGLPETAAVYCSNLAVAEIAEAAIQDAGLTRANPLKPPFFGEGAALNAAGVPMMSYLAGPNYLLAEADRATQLERFDVKRMHKEINALAEMVDQAGAASPDALKP